MLSENDGQGEQLDLLCGRFFVAPPHDRLIRNYLPTNLVARSMDGHAEKGIGSASNQLASLVGLMRMESAGDRAGGRAILNALSLALFTLVLRAASESEKAPEGLLALAGNPRLAPAISAMFADPARPWKLPDLADLCGMSRATFMRQFQDKLGRSALDLLTDLRMSLGRQPVEEASDQHRGGGRDRWVSIRFGIPSCLRRKDGDDAGGVAATGAQGRVTRAAWDREGAV